MCIGIVYKRVAGDERHAVLERLLDGKLRRVDL